MSTHEIPSIAFVGRSKTGKTTLIERLISMFVDQGIKVAVIKHHPHDFEIDVPGKDTYRYKKAGATMSILASPAKIAIVEDTDTEQTLHQILSHYVRNVNLTIIEGFKREDTPKIEVFRRTQEADRPVCEGDKNLIAIVSDDPVATKLPVFSRSDVFGIARFVIERFILRKPS